MKYALVCLLMGITTMSFFSYTTAQKFDLKASTERGKEIYATQCITCHQEQGEGIEGVYPPIAKSDYLMADKKRSIQQLLKGLSGEIKVNGKGYDGVMNSFETLSDAEISDVLNYVRNSFGNKGPAVTPDEVRSTR
ncbi:MAG: cytochrome c [Chryseolinea sp.]